MAYPIIRGKFCQNLFTKDAFIPSVLSELYFANPVRLYMQEPIKAPNGVFCF